LIRRSYKEFPVLDRVVMFAQILSSVNEMHRLGIVHRDLKPENILIIGDLQYPTRCSPVLCDMGGVCSTPSWNWPASGEEIFGTGEYMSPEGWAPGNFEKGRDVWALGIILYQLIRLGDLPLEISKWTEPIDLWRVSAEGWTIEQDPAYQELSYHYPEVAYLMRGMLARNPKTRLSVKDALDLTRKLLRDWGQKYGHNAALQAGLRRRNYDLLEDLATLRRIHEPWDNMREGLRRSTDEFEAKQAWDKTRLD